jgi:hypothetical protein
MFWRPFQDADDLLSCLDVDPNHIGDEIVGRDRAMAAWRWLSRSPSFKGAACEADPPIKGHRIIALGCSAFVSPGLVDEELARPQPGLNARLIAAIAEGRPPALDQAALRHANTVTGLDTVVLYATWRKGLLDRSQVEEIGTLMAFSFLEIQSGYRHRRLICEVIGQEERAFAATTRVWQEVTTFDDPRLQNHPNSSASDRALLVLNREGGLAVAGGVGAMLFQYREPVLRLHEADQQLLQVALRGVTDEELAERLNLNMGAVKKRWLAIFGRISAVRPGLFPETEDDGNTQRRGKQKRHHVLAYLREHPEELRPFDYAQRRTAAPADTVGRDTAPA